MKEAQLLPCPFCGHKGNWRSVLGDDWIECIGCGAATGFGVPPENVVGLWNRRAISPEVKALLEALENCKPYITEAAGDGHSAICVCVVCKALAHFKSSLSPDSPLQEK